MRSPRDVLPVLLSICLAACGDSGPSEPPGLPIDTTGHGGGAASTPGQRLRALEAVKVLVATLPGLDLQAEGQALVAYLNALPQFAEAGTSGDGTVWARLTDGTQLLIPLAPPAEANGGPDPEAVASASAGRPDAVRPLRARSVSSQPYQGLAAAAQASGTASAGAFPGGLPESATYRLFDAMGSYFVPDVRADLAAMLDANGYSGTREVAALDALRNVNGDGIFYIRSHGGYGSFKRDNSTKDMYALWTAQASDSVAEASDLRLRSDLLAHRVVYMMFRAGALSQAFPNQLGPELHYGITQDFVSHYMRFSNNSLVYIDACSSAVLPDFRNGFTTASAFFGWSERAAFLRMGPTATYVFDRLLGANRHDIESPRQRPFPFDLLQFDPRFGHGKSFGYSRVVQGGTPIEATLTFHQLRDNFGLLAPSIYAVAPNEFTHELNIVGAFGDDPGSDGKVTIDDGNGPVSIAVVNWTADLIRADLKTKGPGSYGNVIVEVRGHRSNLRQLLAWEGTMTYTLAEAGTLTQRFDMDLLVRVDVHDARTNPGQPPEPTLYNVFHTPDSLVARYQAAGSFQQAAGMCTAITDWSGKGTIRSAPIPNPLGADYLFGGEVDRQQHTMRMTIAASDPKGLDVTATLKCPLGSQSGSSTIAIGLHELLYANSNNSSSMLDLSLDGAMGVIGHTLQTLVPSRVDQSQALIKLTWPSMTAKPAYDPNLVR